MNNITDPHKIWSNAINKFWPFFIVLFVLSVLMFYCFHTSDGQYYGDDFFFHYRRLGLLAESIFNGTFPVYIDHRGLEGFGYPVKWFYSDFLLIPFALLSYITNVSVSFELLLFCTTLLCGIFTYVSVLKVFRNRYAAFISSLLYTFSVYRIDDLFYRGALGETLAFTFIPLVFWGLYEIITGDYKKWYILAIGYSLLIYSHQSTSLLVFICVIIFLLANIKNIYQHPKRFYYLCIAGVSTLLLTSYYLLPLIELMLSNSFYYENYLHSPQENILTVTRIIKGFSSGFFPIYLSKPGIGILLVAAVCSRLFIKNDNSDPILKACDYLTIAGIVCILLTISGAPWEIFPIKYLKVIIFPWRLFIISSFFFALSGGYYLSVLFDKSKSRLIVISILILSTVFIIISNGKSYTDKYIAIVKTNNKYTERNKDILDFGLLEYTPARFPSSKQYTNLPDISYIRKRKGIISTRNEDTSIDNYKNTNGNMTLDIAVSEPDSAIFPLFCYKGYRAAINEKAIQIQQSDIGLIKIPINESGEIKIGFSGTFLQKYSLYITLASIILLVSYILYTSKRKTR